MLDFILFDLLLSFGSGGTRFTLPLRVSDLRRNVLIEYLLLHLDSIATHHLLFWVHEPRLTGRERRCAVVVVVIVIIDNAVVAPYSSLPNVSRAFVSPHQHVRGSRSRRTRRQDCPTTILTRAA